MATLTQIKKDIQQFFVDRRSLPKHKLGMFHDLNDPSSLGLLFCVNNIQDLEEIRVLLNLIKKSNKNVKALVFYPGYETLDVITHKSITLFDLNDFTLFGKMREELEGYLKKEHFEMLISFAFEPCPFCKFLVSEMRSDFKIGPEEKNELYDLTLKTTDSTSNFLDFFDQVKHYLSVLNIETG